MGKENEVYDLGKLLSEESCSKVEQNLESRPTASAPLTLPQMEENVAESGLPLEEAFSQGESPTPYFGMKCNPQYVLKEEKEIHRAIVYLAASGRTNVEIAANLGVTTVMVAYVRKQTWAKKLTSEILAKEGGDIVRAMLKHAAPKAAEYLIGTVESGKDESGQPISHAVRSANAKEVLDRVYGRSAQVVLSANVDPKELTDEELVKAIQENGGTIGTGNTNS